VSWLWDDPISQNGVALGVVITLGVALFGPVLVMMGRDVLKRWRRREQAVMDETKHDPETTQVGLTERAAAEDAAASHSGEGDVQPLAPVADRRPDAEIDAAMEQRWRAEGIPDTEVIQTDQAPRSGRTVGAATVPAPLISPVRIECQHCKGVGYMPGINDWLTESAALIGENGDEVVRLFYTTLLTAHPELASLFPADISEVTMRTRDSAGLTQRDKLLQAIVALSDLYDPGVPGKMDRLDAALARFGRAHASFARQDGTSWGATLEEYAAVKDALFSTLVRVAGESWRAEYTSAWSQAYDYAAAVMLTEQFRSGFTAPRFPRV
jgi:hemoglobin-like flavoprotein